MAWLQLHLATTEAHADAFQSALEDMGACAVTLTDGADQPVFSGWMIASSPALNALDHARYDVWVMRCKT